MSDQQKLKTPYHKKIQSSISSQENQMATSGTFGGSSRIKVIDYSTLQTTSENDSMMFSFSKQKNNKSKNLTHQSVTPFNLNDMNNQASHTRNGSLYVENKRVQENHPEHFRPIKQGSVQVKSIKDLINLQIMESQLKTNMKYPFKNIFINPSNVGYTPKKPYQTAQQCQQQQQQNQQFQQQPLRNKQEFQYQSALQQCQSQSQQLLQRQNNRYKPIINLREQQSSQKNLNLMSLHSPQQTSMDMNYISHTKSHTQKNLYHQVYFSNLQKRRIA